MTRTRFLTLALLAVLTGTLAVAQNRDKDKTPTRAVQGVVLDPSDQPAAKAVVQLRDTKTKQIKSFISTDDGGYRFFGLNPNIDYEIQASKDGVGKSAVRLLSTFDSRKIANINLKLETEQQ